MAQEIDSVSYSLGVLVGNNLKQQGFDDLDAKAMAEALNDVFSGKTPRVSMDEANAIVQRESNKAQEKAFAGVKQEGIDFLAENAKKEGVLITESGIQYEILKEGNGPMPLATDKVTTHYHGMLIDGKVFDSSVDRGQPATFPVNGVIMGWQEILVMMPQGSKWRVSIPQHLAYGERGAGQDIPPFAALVFEIELISIN